MIILGILAIELSHGEGFGQIVQLYQLALPESFSVFGEDVFVEAEELLVLRFFGEECLFPVDFLELLLFEVLFLLQVLDLGELFVGVSDLFPDGLAAWLVLLVNCLGLPLVLLFVGVLGH